MKLSSIQVAFEYIEKSDLDDATMRQHEDFVHLSIIRVGGTTLSPSACDKHRCMIQLHE
ncbi:hypothetical protein CY34DRAFT_797103 [Suillus luteus UH-Slu-Lm8-n1]|uniref:Uncharacterized protein n=1 Tax=Suillus luteus UH-Slu-Lm8-n1 TaxID=930992 RepID=A0A0D0C4B5_9AGAM|nr:hypothetical protein CY34DRAFT_797103 [Suillus luteus UH-Slu-Lm8-n1]